jgi:hypothetical protein
MLPVQSNATKDDDDDDDDKAAASAVDDDEDDDAGVDASVDNKSDSGDDVVIVKLSPVVSLFSLQVFVHAWCHTLDRNWLFGVKEATHYGTD